MKHMKGMKRALINWVRRLTFRSGPPNPIEQRSSRASCAPRASCQLFFTFFIAFTVLVSGQRQQGPPANPEIYLANLTSNTPPTIASPLTNISNNPGYDSQPSFLPDGSGVLFSSVRGGTQYDIYKYDLSTQKVSQVTDTPDNENSPLVTPDGKTFSAIRSEIPIGAENQRLWRFNLDGSNPSVVLPDLRRIGYHVWVDATHVVVYVLAATQGEPNTLQYVDVTSGQAEVIDKQVGRSLLRRPRTGTVTYVSQPRGEKAIVKEFDPKTKKVTPLVEAVEASTNRDAVWHPSDVLLMSAGSKIFAWRPGATTWVEAGDLSSAGVTNITRMAIFPSGVPSGLVQVRLAIVAEPVAK